ncbi:hypothetical protein TNIN_244781 [Trichonephila inaurata madagascariensis]|uniref:Uncharacterized protein n=1 Tax=Trichonephila inaurata madagascariensis TaxID=2747483 RepID=A0A8X6Y8K0_9ARAC|nr:hypothetical protein TNIN_244781 [Trichonephila inaurata madagascariensis]
MLLLWKGIDGLRDSEIYADKLRHLFNEERPGRYEGSLGVRPPAASGNEENLGARSKLRRLIVLSLLGKLVIGSVQRDFCICP